MALNHELGGAKAPDVDMSVFAVDAFTGLKMAGSVDVLGLCPAAVIRDIGEARASDYVVDLVKFVTIWTEGTGVNFHDVSSAGGWIHSAGSPGEKGSIVADSRVDLFVAKCTSFDHGKNEVDSFAHKTLYS